MCGISALFNCESIDDAGRLIVGMNDLAAHRGPDDEGYYIVGGADGRDEPRGSVGRAELDKRGLRFRHALAHRRLSIIDLSSESHQPFVSSDSRYVLLYNGEIYNYIEIRDELITLGHRFRSLGDAEVVLNAYIEWGERCLSRFNGMFAIVIYDTRDDAVFAARDRFGIKPLYYWRSGGGFLAFASEIKQFTVLPNWNPMLNAQRAFDFLYWGLTDHTSETLFSQIRQLKSGHFSRIRLYSANGAIQESRWYELDTHRPIPRFEAAAEEFFHLLENAVLIRLRADVPVGTALSGGLDSSSIVCLMDAILSSGGKSGQHVFTSSSTIKRFDETPYVDEVVKKTNAIAHVTYPRFEDLFASIDRIIFHQDEPFLSTSIFAEWDIFRTVQTTSVKVTLDGHGADEILSGYHSCFNTLVSGLARQGRFFRLLLELRAIRRNHNVGYRPFLKYVIRGLLPRSLENRLQLLMKSAVNPPDWFTLRGRSIMTGSPYSALNRDLSSIKETAITQVLYTSLPFQLHWCDRDSMAHSIESRLPFLDYRVVEFLVSCPDSYKVARGWTKRILRRAMEGLLPEKVRRRQNKMGFETPEEIWVKANKPVFREQIGRLVETSDGLINGNIIPTTEKVLSGEIPYDSFLWRTYCFSKWMEIFRVRPA